MRIEFYKNNKDIFIKYFEAKGNLTKEQYYDFLIKTCDIYKIEQIIEEKKQLIKNN